MFVDVFFILRHFLTFLLNTIQPIQVVSSTNWSFVQYYNIKYDQKIGIQAGNSSDSRYLIGDR